MSLQLGLIVLPSNTEELNKVLAALAPLGVASSAITTTSTKTAPKAKAAEPEVETEDLPAVTAAEVKTAMTRVRDELGEDTISELLTAFGAKALKEVSKDDWAALVAAANVALDGGNTDIPGDDDFGLDDDDGFGLDDDEAPDAETVKLTVQAYAKKHGKEKAQAILVKFGLNTVRGLASADNATLTKIQAAASKL